MFGVPGHAYDDSAQSSAVTAQSRGQEGNSCLATNRQVANRAVARRPVTHESGISGGVKVEAVVFRISRSSGRRDPADPGNGSLHGPNCIGIANRYGAVGLDNVT